MQANSELPPDMQKRDMKMMQGAMQRMPQESIQKIAKFM
jgi:hypothetical protein